MLCEEKSGNPAAHRCRTRIFLQNGNLIFFGFSTVFASSLKVASHENGATTIRLPTFRLPLT
jgi:hypothetical protein